MTTYEQDVAIDAAVADEALDVVEECAPKKPLWRRIVRGTLIAFGITIVLLVVTGVLLYNFGGMWLPDPQMKAEYSRLVSAGQVPAIEKRFTIPIPGCTCHSKDPVQTMQHSTYRIRECNGCHGGGATGSSGAAPAVGGSQEGFAEDPADPAGVEPADAPATSTEVPPPDPSVPLAIEIPGCVCHSKDPKLVKEHEAYRMNQCAGCHAGVVPTGQ